MEKLTKEEREFLERVEKSYCSKSKGYFTYTLRKKHYKRSRVVYQLAKNVKLNIFEAIHHINGNKEDDRIENLEMMDVSDHASLTNAGIRRANKSKEKNG